MAVNKKITELTELTQPIGEDIFPIVHDPSGTPLNRKVTYLNLQNFVTVARSGGGSYVCDGTADNVQIQAAIDYLSGLGGGTVLIKRGTYNTAAVITLASNVSIIGEGMEATTIKQSSGVNDNVFIGSSKSYFTLRDFTIDGNYTNNPSGDNGLALYDCTKYTVERVRSTANYIKGFVTVDTSEDGVFLNCISDHNNQDGFGFASGTKAGGKLCRRISVIGCYSYYNEQYGIGLIVPNNTFSQTQDMLLLGNRVKDNGTYGIEVFGSKAARVIGNIVEGSGRVSPSTAMGIDLGSLSSIPDFLVTNCIISNNVFKNQAGVTGLDSVGINMQNINDSIITGNRCYDDQDTKTQAYGINFNTGLRNIVTGNNFLGNLTSSTLGTFSATNIYSQNIE